MNVNKKLKECEGRTDDGFCKCLTEQLDQVKKFKDSVDNFNATYVNIEQNNYNKLKIVNDSHAKYDYEYNKLKQDLNDYVGTLKVFVPEYDKNTIRVYHVDETNFVTVDGAKFVSVGGMFMKKENKWMLASDAKLEGCRSDVETKSLFKLLNCPNDMKPGLEIKYKYTKLQIRKQLEKYNRLYPPILINPVLDVFPIYIAPKNLLNIDCCGNEVQVTESVSQFNALATTLSFCTQTTPV